jgi:polygalacturonase
MVENADPERGNENVSVRGGIWDMDNMSQTPNPFARPGPELRAQKEYRAETYLGIVMRFDNVRNLAVSGVTFKDPVTFCVQIARATRFTVDDVTFDFNRGNPVPGNMDGIHVDGGCRFGRISNLKGTTYDDLVALNADDGIDSPCWGPIEDVTIDGIYAEGAHSAVRLLSNHSWVRRIQISNVFGTFYQYGIGITNIFPGEPSDGLFDEIAIRGIHASKAERLAVYLKDDHPVFPIVWVERGCRVGTLSISDLHRRETCTPVECIGVALGAMVQRLFVTSCSWVDETGRAAGFLGNEGEIESLVLSSVRAESGPVLDNRGRIGELLVDGRRIRRPPRAAAPQKPRWRY